MFNSCPASFLFASLLTLQCPLPDLIDGKSIAKTIREELAEQVQQLKAQHNKVSHDCSCSLPPVRPGHLPVSKTITKVCQLLEQQALPALLPGWPPAVLEHTLPCSPFGEHPHNFDHYICSAVAAPGRSGHTPAAG